MEQNSFDYYYSFILKNFGHINLIGSKYLAYVLANYKEDDKLLDVYSRVATATGYSAGSIPKQLNEYIKVILTEYSVMDFEELFNYRFSDPDRLTLSEFLPILKRYLDKNYNELIKDL